jgi:anti-sigma regulatory factor (Ser/Thr protein kinase)
MRRVDPESTHSAALTHAVAAGARDALRAGEPSSQATPLGDALALTLEAEPMVLAGLRRSVGLWLSFHGVEEQERFDLTLAASEAAANAIEHASGAGEATLTVTCERESALVRISVRDNGRWRDSGPYGRGRGLAIMRALVDSLEIEREESGTTVVLTKQRSAGVA